MNETVTNACKICKSNDIVTETHGTFSSKICTSCGTLQSREDEHLEQDGPFTGFTICQEPRIRETGRYRNFIAKTYAVSNVLKLPDEVTEQVRNMADAVWDEKHKLGNNNTAKIAVCILCITRKYPDIHLPIRKLSEICQVPIAKIITCFNKCRNVMNVEPLPYLSFSHHLERVAMFVSMKNHKKLIECALDLESITGTGSAGAGPMNASASLVMVAASILDMPFKRKQICNKFFVKSSTIYGKSHDIKLKLLEYAKKIPWRPPNLKSSNIAKFFPQIVRYYKEFGDAVICEEDEQPVNLLSKVEEAYSELEKEMQQENQHLFKKCKDSQMLLIKELLKKGCTKDELCEQSIISLSRKYLDIVNGDEENDDDSCGILDEEIDGYLHTEEEVKLKTAQQQVMELESS